MAKKSIFSDANKLKGNWKKFEDIGDQIEGTLVGKRQTISQLSGKPQTIYELKTEDGEIWMVGGKPGIDRQMKHVKLGQIVGFRFEAEKPPAKKGLSPTKIIQVYADPNEVDEEWLAENESGMAGTQASATEVKDSNEDDDEDDDEDDEDDEDDDKGNEKSDPVSLKKRKEALPKFKKALAASEVKDKRQEIIDLAKEKLGGKTDDEVKDKVMEATGLAFISANYDELLEFLQGDSE